MSLNTIQTINLDFTVPKVKNVRCVENDSFSRTIHIIITNNGQIYPLDNASMTVNYKINKPDNTYIYNHVPINSDGSVTIELPDQAMTSPGISKSELQVISSINNEILSTMPFNIIVEPTVVSSTVISQNESDVIDSLVTHLSDYNNPHRIPNASTTVNGLTTLTDSITSTSTTTSATANSVKLLNDELTTCDSTIITNNEIDNYIDSLFV